MMINFLKKLKKKKIMINGKDYYIDINRLFSIIEDSDNQYSRKESEIVDSYEISENSELKNKSKIITENKFPIDSQFSTIRYDFLKSVILTVFSFEGDDMNFSVKTCFNTLKESNILKELR